MPVAVVVMGVSGSGKSYLAAKLAEVTGWTFAEGDDYHSPENKAKMAAGIPLTDEDRAPWLAALKDILRSWQQEQKSGILTCSALKLAYRDQLAAGEPEVKWIWPDPPRAVLEERLSHRTGHFMPASLLDSQLAALEKPVGVLRLDGLGPIDEEIEQILAWLDDES